MIRPIVCSGFVLTPFSLQGTFKSTFTGYIYRLRGYHGLGEQSYYHSKGRRDILRAPKSNGHGFSREWRYGFTDEHGEIV